MFHEEDKLSGPYQQLRCALHAQIREILRDSLTLHILQGQVYHRVDHPEQRSALLRHLQPQTQKSL